MKSTVSLGLTFPSYGQGGGVMTHKALPDRPMPAPPVRAHGDRAAGRRYVPAGPSRDQRPAAVAAARVGLGLAGALLAELALIGAVRVAADGCAVTGRVHSKDGLMRAVLFRMLAERQRHSAKDWLTFLAQSAEGDVARRLAGSGYLILADSRRPWSSARWVPADPDCAFAPVIRVKVALDPARPAAPKATALAGLAVACGLGPRVLAYGPPGARDELAGRVRLLGPDLREVIGCTQAAVDSAVLAHRL